MYDRNQRAWASQVAGRRNTVPQQAVSSSIDCGPRAGDIVITKCASSPGSRYTIGRLERQPQLSCASREEALTIARAYAGRQKVGIWEGIRGQFTSIASEEPQES